MKLRDLGGEERSVVRWKDRVKTYIHDINANRWEGIEQARRDCKDMERW